MSDAYKVKKDIAIPRPVAVLAERPDGSRVYATEGRNYGAGSVVFAADVVPDVLERIEGGELDEFLEPVSGDELDDLLTSERSLFIPEHEAENVILREYGHETLGKVEQLELNSAGADAAREGIEAARQDGADERPGLTLPPTTDLAEAAREGKDVVAEPDEDKRHSPRKAPGRKPEQQTAPTVQTPHSGAPKAKAKADGEGGKAA
jgi:hypothetical protein